MVSYSRLARRLTTVIARQKEDRVERYLHAVALELGIAPAELRAEAEQLLRRCAEAGARTAEERLALVATELGMSVDALAEELAQEQQRLRSQGEW